MEVKQLMRVKEEGTALILAFFFLVGVFGHWWNPAVGLMRILTPWVLLIAGLVVFLPFWRRAGVRGRVWILVTYLVTFLLEVVGVETGAVFGTYEYGHVLGAHVLRVPPIIGFNWVLVILGFLRGAQCIVDRNGQVSPASSKGWLRSVVIGAAVLLPAAGALLFDYIMEPVAIALEYWIWDGAAIPLQNYLAWFFIAFGASAAFRLLSLRIETKLPLYYTLIQALFFLALYPLVVR
jgi:bisanhydrobacterioruberin hydratase